MKSSQFTNIKRLASRQPAIIKIGPEAVGGKYPVDCQTNDVNKIEIINALQGLVKLLARQVVEEGKKLFGDDEKAFDAWVIRQQQANNLDN